MFPIIFDKLEAPPSFAAEDNCFLFQSSQQRVPSKDDRLIPTTISYSGQIELSFQNFAKSYFMQGIED